MSINRAHFTPTQRAWQVFGRVTFVSSKQKSTSISVVSVIAAALSETASRITITFNANVSATGEAAVASNWNVIGPAGILTVSNIVVSGTTIVLTTAEQLTGGTYTVTYPCGISNADLGGGLTGAAATVFTGAGTGASIISALGIDEHTVRVIFSKQVTDGLDPTKYTISGGVTVTAVTSSGPTTYTLTTSSQIPAHGYTVTATGVHDVVGNST